MRSWWVDMALLLVPKQIPAAAVPKMSTLRCYRSIPTVAFTWYIDFLPPTLFGVSCRWDSNFFLIAYAAPELTNPVWVQHIPPNQWKGFISQVCPHINLTGNLSSCFESSDPFNRSDVISLQFDASGATLLISTQVNLWLIISNLNHPARGCQPSPRPL